MTWTTPQRFKTDNGLVVLAGGQGPLFVFLHGVGLQSEAWQGICEKLSNDFSIQAIDLPGHGDSEHINISAPRLEDYSNRIAAYLKSLNTPIYLAGHSMGAMIALDIAIRFPKLVKGLAALNAIYQRSSTAARAVQARAAALKGLPQEDLKTDVTLTRWFGDNPSGDRLEAAQSCKRWLHATPITEYQQAYSVFAHHDGPAAAELAQLGIPALFITGSEEPNSTPDMSRQMAEIAPMGTVKIITGAAHMMPMTHAAHVAAALKEHSRG